MAEDLQEAPLGANPSNDILSAKHAREVDRFKRFIIEHKAADQKQRQKAIQAAAYRASNKHWLQAVDHMFASGTGLSLRIAVPAIPPRALKCDEIRYYVPVEQLHQNGRHMQYTDTKDPPGRKKACIKNTTTGQQWVEVTCAKQ